MSMAYSGFRGLFTSSRRSPAQESRSRNRRLARRRHRSLEGLENRCLLAVDLTLNPVADINEDGTATLTGSVSGLAANNEYAITVDWGDGTVIVYNSDGLDPAFKADANGDDTFSVTHQYLDDGDSPGNGTPSDIYTIQVDLQESSFLVGTDAVYVVDLSGSTLGAAGGLTNPVGDQNGDGISNSILDVEIASFKALNQELRDNGLGDVAKVSIVTFGTTATRLDMEPGTPGFQSYTTPNTDSDSNGVMDVDQVLNALTTTPPVTTNYEAGLQAAIAAVNDAGTGPGDGSVIFLSDGVPNVGGAYTDEADTIRDTQGQTLRAFGVGTGSQLGPLQLIDPNAQQFDDPDDLLDLFAGTGEQGGGTDSAETTVTVHNVDPVIDALSSEAEHCGHAVEGEPLSIEGLFSDVGTLDTHTVDIDWGDGNSSAGTVGDAGDADPTTHDFSGNHVYAAGGIYTVTVTVTDDDTGESSAETISVFVTGAGVQGGVLTIVGTDDDDLVSVNQTGNGVYKVHTDFLPGNGDRDFDPAVVGPIDKIIIVLCDGDDHSQISGQITVPSVTDGGEGDDHLSGGGGLNVVLGGPGDDHLNGGQTSDLLIGGTGADRLVGNGGDDLLIAGETAHDANYAALCAILAEWDATKVVPDELDADGDDATVFDDDSADVLTGSAGRDFYFFNPDQDTVTDLKPNESWIATKKKKS